MKAKTPRPAKKEEPTTRLDSLKWLAIAALLAVGVGGNYYYVARPLSMRLIGWLLLACAIAAIGSQTQQGLQLLGFAKQSKVELRKVVWPTRQETVQTTMIVVVMVLVLGMVLWGVDSTLLWAVGSLTAQRG